MGDHRKQDEIDTARVVIAENRRTEFQLAMVEPHVRTQIEIAPDDPMCSPILTLSQEDGGGDIVVEQVAVGRFVVGALPEKVSDYAIGRPITEIVCAAEPLKILLTCEGKKGVRVRACLAVVERPGTYSIVKKENQ